MNPAVALKGIVEGRFGKRLEINRGQLLERPTILIATLDPEIRNGLSEILPEFAVNTVWVKSVEDARSVLATSQIAAVFCEIWLHGGTCRELIWSVRRKSVDLPIIIVSPPNCPVGYRDNLEAMNMKALYFLTHPYRSSDLERFIELAIARDTEPDSHYLAMRTPVLRQRQAT
jgi:DNA-binding NtrC family response regulator